MTRGAVAGPQASSITPPFVSPSLPRFGWTSCEISARRRSPPGPRPPGTLQGGGAVLPGAGRAIGRQRDRDRARLAGTDVAEADRLAGRDDDDVFQPIPPDVPDAPFEPAVRRLQLGGDRRRRGSSAIEAGSSWGRRPSRRRSGRVVGPPPTPGAIVIGGGAPAAAVRERARHQPVDEREGVAAARRRDAARRRSRSAPAWVSSETRTIERAASRTSGPRSQAAPPSSRPAAPSASAGKPIQAHSRRSSRRSSRYWPGPTSAT